MEEKRNGRVEKGLTGSKVGVAITRKGLFPMFMATNFHFNTEFPSVSPFPSFFFPLPFRFFLSFFFSSSYSGFNPFLGRWKKKEEKKRRGIMGPV